MLLFSDNVIQIVRLPRETDGCVPHACKAVGFQGDVVLRGGPVRRSFLRNTSVMEEVNEKPQPTCNIILIE